MENKVIFRTYGEMPCYLWVAAAGLLLAFMQERLGLSETQASWIWLLTCGVIVIMVGYDIEWRVTALIITILIISRLVEALTGWPLIWFLMEELFSRGPPVVNTFAMLVTSGGILVLNVITFAINFFYFYEVSNNRIEQKKFLGKEAGLDTHGLDVAPKYPNALKAIFMFGMGTLVVKNNTGLVLMEAEDVPFLAFRYKKIEAVLEARRFLTAPPPAAEHH